MQKKVYYTDGGCRNNPGLGAWAYAYIESDLLVDYDTGIKEMTTNNEMELTAIYKVIDMQVLPCELEIHSDSTYAINTISQWANKWIKEGSLNSRPNFTLIWEIMKAKEQFEAKGGKVSFVKVKAHSGEKWNEFVDRELNEAMDEYLFKVDNNITSDVSVISVAGNVGDCGVVYDAVDRGSIIEVRIPDGIIEALNKLAEKYSISEEDYEWTKEAIKDALKSI